MSSALDDPTTQRLIRGLLDLAADRSVLGVWLHGSAATDDWMADVSPLDLIVITREELSDEERQDWRSALEGLFRSYGSVKTEIFVAAYPNVEFQIPYYELIARLSPTAGTVIAGPDSDTKALFEFASAREGITLLGPPASEVFGSVSAEELVMFAAADLEGLQSIDEYFRDVPQHIVLQAARIWYLVVEGRLVTEFAAGAWAEQRWKNPEVIRTAMKCRRGDPRAIVAEADARLLLAHVLGECNKMLGEFPES